MSTSEPIGPGALLGTFRLVERVGASVWRAEDVRSGKTLAVKILATRLPVEPARREAALRDVRLAAALMHPNIVPIDEIAAAGEALVMVMPFLDARPVSRISTSPAAPEAFFRIAWQLAEALRFLHGKQFIHGNINGDSVLVLPSGEVRVAGINLSNLMPRKDGMRPVPDDVRRIAYFSPEHVTQQQPIDARSDIYSAGVVLYQVATAKLPFDDAVPAELGRKIVSEAPLSPKVAHPSIEASVMTVLGRSLFKDSLKRYRDARHFGEDVAAFSPEAKSFAEGLSRQTVAVMRPASADAGDERDVLLFVADVANYDEMVARDPAAASKAAATMQQVLGEAVYLFDGKVIDPFGPRMIAELPSAESALEAARKGEFDLRPPKEPGVEILHVRFLLHAGKANVTPTAVSGPAVDKALAVLDELQPLQLFITEDFLSNGRGSLRYRDAGARGGVKLFTIVPAEGSFDAGSSAVTGESAPESQHSVSTVVMPPPPVAVAPKKKRRGVSVLALVIGLLAFGVGAFLVWSRHANEPETKTAVVAPAQAPAVPRKIYIDTIVTDPADATLAPRAEAIRLATIEMLQLSPGIELAKAPGPDVIVITGQMRGGASGVEFTASAPGMAGAPVAAADAASGIRALLEVVGTKSNAKARTSEVPDALNAFADAIAARASNDQSKFAAALRTAMNADPAFLPAQLVAMETFSRSGNEVDALAAARNILAIDRGNVDAARRVARASLPMGQLPDALSAYNAILAKTSADAEALNVIASYALASGDQQLFASALKRLSAVPRRAIAVHEPDALVAAGRIEAAINKYYDIEVEQPDNPALALKIGRLSVLRRSLSIAELEMKKLEQLDPIYGLPLLRAYIAAEKQDIPGAMKALQEAERSAQPYDSFWTSAAEVHAILAGTKGVLDSLEKAAARNEPTGAYILASPLFRYLANDARFKKLEPRFRGQAEEVRALLAAQPAN